MSQTQDITEMPQTQDITKMSQTQDITEDVPDVGYHSNFTKVSNRNGHLRSLQHVCFLFSYLVNWQIEALREFIHGSTEHKSYVTFTGTAPITL